MLPLVLTNLSVGQRHYFDCFESAFGGLTANKTGKYDTVRDLYCLFDAVALVWDEKDNIQLKSRVINVDESIRKIFGFTLRKFRQFSEFSKSYDGLSVFVVVFDEYYLKENQNYLKTHFTHASIVKKMIDKNNLIVVDPGLEITKPVGYSADERELFIPDELYESNSCFFYTLGTEDKEHSYEVMNITKMQNQISKFNLNCWENVENQSVPNFLYGKEALIEFGTKLSNKKIIAKSSTEFYKWIFPLFWKKNYIENLNTQSGKELAKILSGIIKELEIFETNLMRLVNSTNESLYVASQKRWEKIIELISIYIRLEKERVYGE